MVKRVTLAMIPQLASNTAVKPLFYVYATLIVQAFFGTVDRNELYKDVTWSSRLAEFYC